MTPWLQRIQKGNGNIAVYAPSPSTLNLQKLLKSETTDLYDYEQSALSQR